jgi:hypothetical protein
MKKKNEGDALQKTFEKEKELLDLFKSSRKENSLKGQYEPSVIAFLEDVWNLDKVKKLFEELGLDTEKLPFGKLCKD